MKLLFVSFLLLATLACASKPAVENVAATTDINANSPVRSEKLQTVTAHSTENQDPATNANAADNSKMSQPGEPIDTKKYDAAIATAESAVKTQPSNAEVRKAAAQAYFERAFALTEARQYAAALGDYRKALRLDPNDADARKWIDQIVGIYQMLKKQPPKEGEEPPALPFKG